LDASAVASLRPTLLRYAEQLAPILQNAWQTRRALNEALANPQPDDAAITQLTNQLSADRDQSGRSARRRWTRSAAGSRRRSTRACSSAAAA
jgi:hypothetical protein